MKAFIVYLLLFAAVSWGAAHAIESIELPQYEVSCNQRGC